MANREFAHEGGKVGPKKDYMKEAIEAVKNDPHIVFMEDVAIALGTTVKTLAHYNISWSKCPEIAELLQNNRTAIKKKLRKNWEGSEKNSLHLYKILSRKDEHDKLMGTAVEFKGDPIKIIVNGEDPGEKAADD